ncbi:unnamed protein product [Macrosiphum euphorbiae]|uniref:Uncharacterized protein n=1 Tax=Macrosiphum euphorbiae TaxID=13131 RepID=A0AAV0XHX1_9HEMI|nr:unnamed protein product [Macrosiphum euphorbiae]
MENVQEINIASTSELDLCISTSENIADIMNDIHITPNNLPLIQAMGDTVDCASCCQSDQQLSVQGRKPGIHDRTGENVFIAEDITTMQIVQRRKKNLVKHSGKVYLWKALNEALRVAAISRSINFVFAVYLPRPVVVRLRTGHISARILPPQIENVVETKSVRKEDSTDHDISGELKDGESVKKRSKGRFASFRRRLIKIARTLCCWCPSPTAD